MLTVHCKHSGMVPVADLKPHPRNPNTHPKKQVELIAKVLRHQGWRAPVVVSNRSGYIVAGHGRTLAAKHLGETMVPVDRQDFATESDELAHLVADNKLAEQAIIDNAELAGLLKELDGMDFDTQLAGIESLLRDVPELKETIRNIDALEEGRKTVDQGSAVEKQDTPTQSQEAAKRVVAIMLTASEYQLWQTAKEKAEITDDTRAFKALLLKC